MGAAKQHWRKFFFIALALLIVVLEPDAAVGQIKPTLVARQQFEQQMLKMPLPTRGCFVARFGNARWQQVKCAKAPTVPNPMAKGAKPNNVGAGRDYFLASPTLISEARGSFDSLSGVTALAGPTYYDPQVAHTNVYSLQMNANTFSTSACGSVANCFGWEQFLYSRTQCAGGCIFIEYWLLNHPNPCPSGQGWVYYAGSSTTASGCFFNTTAANIPPQQLSDLGGIRLTGRVAGAQDTVSMSVASGNVYARSNASIAGLGQGWQTVEYNLVGDCCAYGTYFTSGPATLNVRIEVTNGSTAAPTCSTVPSGATAETNNLNLVAPCRAFGGAQPAIAWTESGGGPLPPGLSQGDTHLTTINGTHYDFQETGEYVLVRGSSLTVQARQDLLNGNRSVSWNTGLAIQIGKDLVILRPTGDLTVNGTKANLPDGGAIALTAGASVGRQGNLYTITRPEGDTIQGTIFGDHIDVTVQLNGAQAAVARGLLVDSDGSLQSRTGNRLGSSPTRAAMHDYVESWRVDPPNSLFPDDGRPMVSGPIIPDNRLPTGAAREKARAVCLKAGVSNAVPMADCILDVAIGGNEALADTYVHTRPPRRTVVVN